ncbi:MAG: hypothetical protein GX089_17035 [Fibrobacter sp.]|nr:hypothetical protein [Fibrobacter sp.]
MSYKRIDFPGFLIGFGAGKIATYSADLQALFLNATGNKRTGRMSFLEILTTTTWTS